MTDTQLGRLLVVDDNEMNRDMLSRRLIRRGYEVILAEGGTEAIALVEKESFDAVLLDIMMPEVSGWDVLKWIRERFSRSQLPVIMVTAKDSSEDIVQALQEGANDYVTKPLDLKVVLARVGTHVILKQTSEELRYSNLKLKKANEQLKNDLQAAANIQQSQLPSQKPRLEGCEVSWVYKPCDELAGDFLDVFDIDEDYVGIYLLDVSGHGVPAALMSVAVSRALKPSPDDTCVISKPDRTSGSLKKLQVNSPCQILDKLNERFPSDLSVGQFFTIIYGIFNKNTKELIITSAGHPKPIIYDRNGNSRFADVESGYPIGILQLADSEYEPYVETVLPLNQGDRVYFYSDGVPEAMNDKEEQFGEVRMIDCLDQCVENTLDNSVTSLLDEVLRWTSPSSPADDVSVLAFEVL